MFLQLNRLYYILFLWDSISLTLVLVWFSLLYTSSIYGNITTNTFQIMGTYELHPNVSTMKHKDHPSTHFSYLYTRFLHDVKNFIFVIFKIKLLFTLIITLLLCNQKVSVFLLLHDMFVNTLAALAILRDKSMALGCNMLLLTSQGKASFSWAIWIASCLS